MFQKIKALFHKVNLSSGLFLRKRPSRKTEI